MPGRLVHVVSSSFAGATVGFVRSGDQPDATRIYEIFGSFVGGYVGGRLPDMIDDSARTPDHRGRTHSVAAGAGLLTIAWETAVAAEQMFRRWADSLTEQERALPETSLRRALLGLVIALCRMLAGFFTGLVAGCVTHLVLDGMTPRSLRLI